jgi:hypothetical protein
MTKNPKNQQSPTVETVGYGHSVLSYLHHSPRFQPWEWLMEPIISKSQINVSKYLIGLSRFEIHVSKSLIRVSVSLIEISKSLIGLSGSLIRVSVSLIGISKSLIGLSRSLIRVSIFERNHGK